VNTLFGQMWREQEGALTFEWILLITVLVIGIVGGVSAVRDAIISELGDVAGAAVAVDQSYTVVASPSCGGTEFGFQDELPECTGTGTRPEEPPVTQVITECGP
jgi:Flp pilus assembly pilin Flp